MARIRCDLDECTRTPGTPQPEQHGSPSISRSTHRPTDTTLRSGNRTPDSEIARRADSDQRVVVTKDRDFRDNHLLDHTPHSLLIVTTGNIQNRDLLALFERHIDVIAEYLTDSPLVELSRDRLVAHSSNGTKE